MPRRSDHKPAFYVVQFIELPFEGIDDYACVPNNWVIIRKATDDRAVVAYPKDEDPFDTRDRAKRKERYNDEWRFYMANVKYESNSYNDAEFWIATRNDYGPLVEEVPKVTETQPKISVNMKLRSANQNHSSKSNDNFRNPLPRTSIKRPAKSESKKEIDEKRLKLDESAQSSQIENVQSVANVDDHKLLVNEVSSPKLSTIYNGLVSPKMSANLYSHMNGARRLIPIHEPVEKIIRPTKMERNLAIASQNPSNSIDQARHLSTRSVEQAAVVTPELAQQRQVQPNHLNSQQQLQRPKLRIDITIKPKDRKQTPSLQGVTKKTLSPILTKVLNSMRKALSTTHNNFHSNNPHLQARMSLRSSGDNNVDLTTSPQNIIASETSDRQNTEMPSRPIYQPSRIEHVTGSHLNVMDNACQTDENMVDETRSPYHAVTSDSDPVTDQEVISDHEMSTDEAPAETTNNVYGTANDPGHGSADRPTAAQNSMARSHQMNSKLNLEQKMLDNFAALFTQMGTTLRHTTDMYNTLRSSILDTAELYKKLLGAVEQFNTAGNAANNAPPSTNLIPDVPRSPEERHTNVSAVASSSNHDQHSIDVANKAPKKKHRKLYRFVLPPEYDAHDTRWTLKYRTYLPGLVELVPESGVYISYGDLIYCKQVSKDCKSLALRLLSVIFNRNALSVCSSMSETAKAAYRVGSNIRPDLDDNACSVLLNFVIEHGLQRGWNTDLKPILNTLHSKMQEIRFKYGVMVECYVCLSKEFAL